MADLFPISVILHFPPEVYLSRGTQIRSLRCSSSAGAVFASLCASNDLMFEDKKIPVTPAGVHVVTVYVCDLPVEVSVETVKSAFSYSEVYSCLLYTSPSPRDA